MSAATSGAAAAATTRHTPAAASGGLTMRPGRGEDAAELSALALRSKGFWGYSASFMRAVEAELTLDADAAARTVVCMVDGQVAGFHLLGESRGGPGARDSEQPAGELEMLFVDPQFIGSGLGRVLFEHARRAAAGRGWSRLFIEADPNSRTFYERVGAVQVGERLSGSIPGRSLPLFELALRPAAGGGSVGAGRASYWR